MTDEIKKASNQQSEKTSGQFDLSDILAVIWRRKWLIILPIILVTAVTAGISYLIAPEYESSTIVWVGNPVKLSAELQRLLGDATQGYRSVQDRRLELQSLVNEITSSPVIFQLIGRLKLDENPKLDETASKMRQETPNLTIEQIKLDILVQQLRSQINVEFAGNDQIRITTTSGNPNLAKSLAEALADIYIAEKMKQERGVLRTSGEFTYEQLTRYENDLQDRIDEKTDLEKEFNRVRLDDPITSEDNRDAISSEITAAETEIEDYKQDERAILSAMADIGSRNLQLDESETYKSIKYNINNHLGLIANLMQRYSWNAPEIVNHRTRLFNLINEIEAEIIKLVNQQFTGNDAPARRNLARLFTVRYELDVLYARLNSLKLAKADLEKRIDFMPEYTARLEQIDREITAARDLRDKFRDQQESSQISQALLRDSKYKIIEPAKVPLEPFKPKRSQIIVLGLLLGIALGGAAAMMVEILDKSFRKIDDVERALGIPVIGVVPVIESVRKFNLGNK